MNILKIWHWIDGRFVGYSIGILTFIAIGYLVIKKNDSGRYVLAWPSIIMLAVFNPVVNEILVDVYGYGNRVERFMWNIPSVLILSVFLVDIWDELKKRKGLVLTIVLAVAVLLMGMVQHLKVEPERLGFHPYYMDDELMEICEIIESDSGGEDVFVISDPAIVWYPNTYNVTYKYFPFSMLRTYNPHMLSFGYETEYAKQGFDDQYKRDMSKYLYLLTEKNKESNQETIELLDRYDARYLITKSMDEDYIKSLGFDYLEKTDNYIIYKR